jgi:hypothetical protein
VSSLSDDQPKGWDVVVSPNEDRHVVATRDIQAHIVDGLTCPCEPFMDADDAGLIIHNAFDGREIIERLERGEAP